MASSQSKELGKLRENCPRHCNSLLELNERQNGLGCRKENLEFYTDGHCSCANVHGLILHEVILGWKKLGQQDHYFIASRPFQKFHPAQPRYDWGNRITLGSPVGSALLESARGNTTTSENRVRARKPFSILPSVSPSSES